MWCLGFAHGGWNRQQTMWEEKSVNNNQMRAENSVHPMDDVDPTLKFFFKSDQDVIYIILHSLE